MKKIYIVTKYYHSYQSAVRSNNLADGESVWVDSYSRISKADTGEVWLAFGVDNLPDWDKIIKHIVNSELVLRFLED